MDYKPSDFNLINDWVSKYQKRYDLKSNIEAFYFFSLDLLFNMQKDEIEDSITDNNYLMQKKEGNGGEDKGIDAVVIDNDNNIIHFFNYKYATKFKKATSNFEGGEIPKLYEFFNILYHKQDDEDVKELVNPILFSKLKEIWSIMNSNPTYVIHLCANQFEGLENNTKKHFEKEMLSLDIKVEYHFLSDFTEMLLKRNRKIVDAKIRINKKELFKIDSQNGVRALIANFNALDCVRMVLDDEAIRKNDEIEDLSILKNYTILEDAFNDNVRIYIKQKSRINKGIVSTVLDEENNPNFFYFNNGLTLTCKKFKVPKNDYPAVEFSDIQIVNGSQTVHALFDAMQENIERVNDARVLCRVYEIDNNPQLSGNIAQYTNSQNPVNGRDIRAIDYMQINIEKQFEAKGIYYERKKNQYIDQTDKERIDGEKVGQVLLSFYNKKPYHAKNQKRLIYTDYYEDIFSENINASKILLAYRLYQRIEVAKIELNNKIADNKEDFDKKSYIRFASFYILFILSELAEHRNIKFELENIDNIWELYNTAILIIEKAIEIEQEEKEFKYTHTNYFKSQRPLYKIHKLKENTDIFNA